MLPVPLNVADENMLSGALLVELPACPQLSLVSQLWFALQTYFDDFRDYLCATSRL